jgi:capsular polysaccharide export protein
MKPALFEHPQGTHTDVESHHAQVYARMPSLADAKPFVTRLSAMDGARRILLLQGPVGPFFGDLRKQLQRRGFVVDRIAFTPADRLFAGTGGIIRFSGGPALWRDWLDQRLAGNPPEAIILFGADRPAHSCARAVAQRYGIRVISLEEGYLRSGYVTCEVGGNNRHSPLAKWRRHEHVHLSSKRRQSAPPLRRSSFIVMSVCSAIHYLVRDALSKAGDAALFHRDAVGPTALAWLWGSHAARRLLARVVECTTLRRLRQEGDYVLVPLQVPTDSQLMVAARGWTTSALIESCLQALARSDRTRRLVFKIHPLDPSGARVRRDILNRAADLGLGRNRVHVVHTGRMGDLARHATGMIVINSTSAFSALHHNVPVLVLGQAVYRHDTIVTAGDTASDIDAFLRDRRPKARAAVDAFIADLKDESLLPGDFYLRSGRQTAVNGIIARLDQLSQGRCVVPQ